MSKIQLSKNFIKSSCKLALNEDLYPSGDITSELVNKNIKKVGVFVDPEIEYLNFIIKKYSLDLVQLHGNEKPDFISQIRDVKIIKAFSIDKL